MKISKVTILSSILILFIFGCKNEDSSVKNNQIQNKDLYSTFPNKDGNQNVNEVSNINLRTNSFKNQNVNSDTLKSKKEDRYKIILLDTIIKFDKLNLIDENDSLKFIFQYYTSRYFENQNPLMYRFTNNTKYYIKYNANTFNNELYTKDGIKLGEIKLEVNNNEFSINTIPLESGSGIVYFDGLNGFTIYSVQDKTFIKKREIKFKDNSIHLPYFTKKDDRLFVINKNFENQTASLSIYSLQNGGLIKSNKIEYFNDYLFDFDSGLLALFLDNDIKIYNIESNKEFIIPLLSNSSSFYITKFQGIISGVSFSKNDLKVFIYDKDRYSEKHFLLPENFHLISCKKYSDYFSLSYFSGTTETQELYSNRNKQGILYFEFYSNKLYNLILPDQDVNLNSINYFKDSIVIVDDKYFFPISKQIKIY